MTLWESRKLDVANQTLINNLNFMKNFKKCILTILILFGSNIYSQVSKTNASDFVIILSAEGDSFVLQCHKDCIWGQINISRNKQWLISESGAVQYNAENEKAIASSKFCFTTSNDKNKIIFRSKTGTSWKELSFNVEPKKKYQIDSSGMKQL